MNELPTGMSLTGQWRAAEVLTCGDAGGFLRVCTQAGNPGLEDESQQQKLRLSCAPTHLPPLQGPCGRGTPPPCGGELLARARGPLVRPGGSERGQARAAELRPESDRRAGAPAPRATYRLWRGRQRGGPCPGYWPPTDPPCCCVRQCGRLPSLLSLASGLFAQFRPI